MPPRAKSPRAWQRMLSGRRLDLLDPTPFDIEIADIAHGLAFVARWNGQTQGDWPYSVAEHSLLVERIFSYLMPQSDAGSRLAALLHDAPEYVIGDMISPVKSALGVEYGEIDRRISAAIHRRFGLPATLTRSLHRQIKTADRISARIEAERIAGFTANEAKKLFPVPQTDILDSFSITLRPPAQVRQAYLARFDELMAQFDQGRG
ncbi:MAG: HD family hydrolase [Paracoccus sp. (in: a-proteobacteria)]|uniref:HD family hydrolase n=1 Tax=Paracoccus sp. TaxID=267 RepID=UPI0026E02B90|nr:HD family hydrolase [Paracoccus sp. (in: a-proteobacteria)]MDO5614035.1 HD family hydrolase [Paracoccus sp. (in: a-proteobacteria)]